MQLCFDSSRTMFSIAIAGRRLRRTADKQASSHRQHQVADAQTQRSSRRPMPRLNLPPYLAVEVSENDRYPHSKPGVRPMPA